MSGLARIAKTAAWAVLHRLPYGRAFHETQSTQTPISFESILRQRILRQSSNVYWPIHSSSLVQSPERVWIGVETSPGLMPGCYVQGTGGIVIGDYTQVGPNVGIISSNHDLYDSRQSIRKPVRIGAYCWLGMGSVVLPGVTLGPHTVVAAGAVVTRSFPEGHVVLSGVPARVTKRLEPERCVKHVSRFCYHGFVRAEEFEAFSRRALAEDVIAMAGGA